MNNNKETETNTDGEVNFSYLTYAKDNLRLKVISC